MESRIVELGEPERSTGKAIMERFGSTPADGDVAERGQAVRRRARAGGDGPYPALAWAVNA
jgi:hypothetical protein